ncbi:MAG: hypothetical protein ACFFBP_00690, partial [Promethearchaeota archaeon]
IKKLAIITKNKNHRRIMDDIEFFFNIFNCIVGLVTIISVIVLILEFRRSNKIRRLKKYYDILDNIQLYIYEIYKNKKNQLDEDIKKSISKCIRNLILIKYNLKLKNISQLNITISKLSEFFFNFQISLDKNKLKNFEEETENLFKIIS